MRHGFANTSIPITHFRADCTGLKDTYRDGGHCANTYYFSTRSALDDGKRWRMRFCDLNKARAHSSFHWAPTALGITSASSASPVPPSRLHTTLGWLFYPQCNEVFYSTRVYYSFID